MFQICFGRGRVSLVESCCRVKEIALQGSRSNFEKLVADGLERSPVAPLCSARTERRPSPCEPWFEAHGRAPRTKARRGLVGARYERCTAARLASARAHQQQASRNCSAILGGLSPSRDSKIQPRRRDLGRSRFETSSRDGSRKCAWIREAWPTSRGAEAVGRS